MSCSLVEACGTMQTGAAIKLEELGVNQTSYLKDLSRLRRNKPVCSVAPATCNYEVKQSSLPSPSALARKTISPEAPCKAIEREYAAVAKRLWLPALDHLEREIRAASGFDLPREIDLLATILPYPQIRSIEVPRERTAALRDLVNQVRARRWATHPWRF